MDSTDSMLNNYTNLHIKFFVCPKCDALDNMYVKEKGIGHGKEKWCRKQEGILDWILRNYENRWNETLVYWIQKTEQSMIRNMKSQGIKCQMAFAIKICK